MVLLIAIIIVFVMTVACVHSRLSSHSHVQQLEYPVTMLPSSSPSFFFFFFLFFSIFTFLFLFSFNFCRRSLASWPLRKEEQKWHQFFTLDGTNVRSRLRPLLLRAHKVRSAGTIRKQDNQLARQPLPSRYHHADGLLRSIILFCSYRQVPNLGSHGHLQPRRTGTCTRCRTRAVVSVLQCVQTKLPLFSCIFGFM